MAPQLESKRQPPMEFGNRRFDMDKAPTKDSEQTYDKYAAENDLRSLTEAARIRKDPMRMKHAKRAAKDKLAEMDEMKKLVASD
jgi:hypothetical protein